MAAIHLKQRVFKIFEKTYKNKKLEKKNLGSHFGNFAPLLAIKPTLPFGNTSNYFGIDWWYSFAFLINIIATAPPFLPKMHISNQPSSNKMIYIKLWISANLNLMWDAQKKKVGLSLLWMLINDSDEMYGRAKNNF